MMLSALSFEPLRSALARVVSVKSMRVVSVKSMRVVSVKSMVEAP